MAGLERYRYGGVVEVEDDYAAYSVRAIPARRLPPQDLPIKPFIVQPVVEEDDTNEEQSKNWFYEVQFVGMKDLK